MRARSVIRRTLQRASVREDVCLLRLKKRKKRGKKKRIYHAAWNRPSVGVVEQMRRKLMPFVFHKRTGSALYEKRVVIKPSGFTVYNPTYLTHSDTHCIGNTDHHLQPWNKRTLGEPLIRASGLVRRAFRQEKPQGFEELFSLASD